MSKISVYIIAYNQERKISRAIKSVIDWADEVIVADAEGDEVKATRKVVSEVEAAISKLSDGYPAQAGLAKQ